MVNVGLRAYLWNQKDRQQRVTRELWSVNGVTYHAFRQYTSHVKEHGFPDQAVDATRTSALPPGKHPTLHPQLSLASQSSLAWKSVRSITFGGARASLTNDVEDARGSYHTFERFRSELQLLSLLAPAKILALCLLKIPCSICWQVPLHERLTLKNECGQSCVPFCPHQCSMASAAQQPMQGLHQTSLPCRHETHI